MRVSPFLLCIGIVGCRSIRPATAFNQAGTMRDAPNCLGSPPRSTLALENGHGGSSLLGRVAQIANTAPIRQALVRVEPGGHVAQPDDNGFFRFIGIGTGRYIVRVQALGYESVADSITIGQDGLNIIAAMARFSGETKCTPSSPGA
jgi:Carboxypeptidase regulatory-like domain